MLKHHENKVFFYANNTQNAKTCEKKTVPKEAR